MNTLDVRTQKQGKLSSQQSDLVKPRLMLFDLSIYGHHPSYIQHLIQYWHHEKFSGELIVLVSPRFLTEHADVVLLAEQLKENCIRFVAITEAEHTSLRPRSNGINRNLRNFQEWQILCRYATDLQIDHILLMYYDTYQYPLALNILPPPCPVSGIYFRPTFHYETFPQYTLSKKEKLQQTWEQFVLNRVLGNSKVDTLLSLDPFVVEHVKQFDNRSKVIHLADPVKLHSYSPECLDALKQSLGIESDRKMCLLFGALTERKGIYQLLEAIPLLNPDVHRQLAFVFVGESHPSHQQRINQSVEDLQQRYSVQVIHHYQFVPDEDVQKYFQISDIVLAPYQKHVGMSGILILAAAAQKPVLSSNYGLMGEVIRRYQLGLSVDTTDPQSIAQGLTQFINQPETLSLNCNQMHLFAQRNSAQTFAKTIFGRLRKEKKTATVDLV